MQQNHFIKKIHNILNDIVYNVYFQSLLVVIIFDVFYAGINLWNDFFEDMIGSTVIFLLLYVLSVVIVRAIHHLRAGMNVEFNADVKREFHDIVQESKKHLYLVTPYFSPGNVVIEEILSKLRDGVHVEMVLHSSQMQNIETFTFFERFNSLGGKMWHHPKLHSKIYLNDKFCLITSLNLLTSSFDNSFEAGVSFNNRTEIKNVLQHIQKEIIGSDLISEVKADSFSLKFGYCIRSRQKINLNKSRPVEYSEYRSGGSNLNGQYCHLCGEKADTSIDNPYCEAHQTYN